jgi:predicted house-cleaning noncanonical NTP pyrophosphatase (MazG superfamily)
MTAYNKLVRDKIPEYLDDLGVPYEKRIASEEEYKAELVKKLVEEAKEFAEAGNCGELADVVEVIEALKRLPEYSDVEIERQKKLEAKGGFDKRIILKGNKNE